MRLYLYDRNVMKTCNSLFKRSISNAKVQKKDEIRLKKKKKVICPRRNLFCKHTALFCKQTQESTYLSGFQ